MYNFLRSTFLSGDPEAIHLKALDRLESLQSSSAGRALLRLLAGTPRRNPAHTMSLPFAHPVGLAAGFDKDARAVIALQEMGFSFVEVGTVTPRSQPGNPQPRLWRFPEERSLINAMGFPGEGMDTIRGRLLKIRGGGLLRIPIGINLGKNLDTPVERAVDDYIAVLKLLYDVGDYFVANISSPNTPGLRNLQSAENLRGQFSALVDTANDLGHKPLLLKIAPDLSDPELLAIAQFVRETGLRGIIAGNTTINRGLIPGGDQHTRGGLSGPALFPRTLEMISLLRSKLPTEFTLIAAGGIESREQVESLLAAGADLVQVYTSFIFLGPRCAKILNT
jgi:dihydroorotate dehydrogenase